jgi:hypothetical protein
MFGGDELCLANGFWRPETMLLQNSQERRTSYLDCLYFLWEKNEIVDLQLYNWPCIG